jgi:hypothetical protein
VELFTATELPMAGMQFEVRDSSTELSSSFTYSHHDDESSNHAVL